MKTKAKKTTAKRKKASQLKKSKLPTKKKVAISPELKKLMRERDALLKKHGELQKERAKIVPKMNTIDCQLGDIMHRSDQIVHEMQTIEHLAPFLRELRGWELSPGMSEGWICVETPLENFPLVEYGFSHMSYKNGGRANLVLDRLTGTVLSLTWEKRLKDGVKTLTLHLRYCVTAHTMRGLKAYKLTNIISVIKKLESERIASISERSKAALAGKCPQA